MKKYASLIFKDFIIMNYYMLFTLLIIVGMPLLFLPISSIGTGIAGFTISYVFALYTTSQSLAYYEARYSKAETILNSAPFSKRAIVISRYIFLLLIYAVALIVYVLMSLIIPQLETITVVEAIIVFFIGSILMGVLQPLTYKFGVAKMRYINVFIMIGVGIGFPYLIRAIVGGNVNFDFPGNVSPVLVGSLTLLLSLIILIVSAVISIKIYKKKEF